MEEIAFCDVTSNICGGVPKSGQTPIFIICRGSSHATLGRPLLPVSRVSCFNFPSTMAHSVPSAK
jgi:hypothetical protein